MNKGYESIGRNIKTIRKTLGLSLKSFSELTGVSKSTIVNIENNHVGLKIDTVNKLLFFTGFTTDDVNKKGFTVPVNFRETLVDRFKDVPQILHFFTNKPTIKNAIDEKLKDSDFFQVGREINEIVSFFEDFGWIYKGTSIQNELKKHQNVKIKNHSSKKGTFIYLKK